MPANNIGRTKVAIIGSGNIGTDLMFKIIRLSDTLEMGAMVGIDAASDGLARARRLGYPTTSEGVRGLLELPVFNDIGAVFDATSAKAHLTNAALLESDRVEVTGHQVLHRHDSGVVDQHVNVGCGGGQVGHRGLVGDVQPHRHDAGVAVGERFRPPRGGIDLLGASGKQLSDELRTYSAVGAGSCSPPASAAMRWCSCCPAFTQGRQRRQWWNG